MKNPARFLALAAALATLGYVTYKSFPTSASRARPSSFEQKNHAVVRAIDDIDNVAQNLARSIEQDPATKGRSGGEVKELIRLVGELSRANAAQQQTISQLSTEKSAAFDDAVTLVGIASTLLGMVLAWRSDRRQLMELKAKLAAGPVATT